MTGPSEGYDDESVIPRSRLRGQLVELENELETIQRLFDQTHSMENSRGSHDFSGELSGLKATAAELGQEYLFLVDKLLDDYQSFKMAPDLDKLEQLFSDVKNLQLLLN